jgi:hypothetical protein
VNAVAASSPQNPFPGPLAYRPSDQEYFFGRMDEIEELTSFVLSSSATLLYAPSGTGKSSLLQAGVAPHLEQEFHVAVLPFVYLGHGIQSTADGESGNKFVAAVCDTIGGNELDLAAAAATHRSDESQLVLLVLDQFEEVFTDQADWRHRDEFFVILKQTLATHSWLRVVIALRSDYLAELVPHEQNLPGNLVVRYQLEPLARPQASDAIRSAFEATGVELADDDLTRVLDLLTGDPRVPRRHGKYVNTIQLQIVCRRLWQEQALPSRAGAAVLDQDSLFTLGTAVVRFVDEAIAQVVSDGGTDEVTVRWWLRHRLITPSGRRAFVQVGEEHTAGLANSVVTALAGVKLLQLEKRHGTRLAELTHDSMAQGVLESTDGWLKVRGRRRAIIAGALFAVFVVLLAAFSFLRAGRETPLLDRSGLAGKDAVSASFQATNSAAVIQLSVLQSGSSVRLSARSDSGAELGTVSAGADAVISGDQRTQTVIPTNPGATYTVFLTSTSPQARYELHAWAVPRAPVVEDHVTDLPSTEVAIDLGKSGIQRLSVGGATLNDVYGVRILATDPNKDWVVVDSSASSGLVSVSLAGRQSDSPPEGATIRLWRMATPTKLKVGESAQVQVDGAALLAFSAAENSGPLGLEGNCSEPVLPSPVNTAGVNHQDSEPFFDSHLQTLPLPSREKDQRIVLSQVRAAGPTQCTVTVRTFAEPKLGPTGIRQLELGQESPAKGYDVTPDEDTVFSSAKLPEGLSAQFTCPISGDAITNDRNDRLLAFVPARASCTLWLSRDENAPAGPLRLAVRSSPATSDGGR